MQKIYKVHASKLSQLQSQIERLNRRAARIGASQITLHIGDVYSETHRVPELDNREMIFRFHDVTISGEAPVIDGYRVKAHLEWTVARDDEGNIVQSGNLISSFPAADGGYADVPAKYRDMKPVCEHCGSNHYRKYTFVIENIETTEHMMVGTTCIHNYTGTDSPFKWGSWGEWLRVVQDELDEACSGGFGSNWDGVDIKSFVAQTLACIERFGYTSGKAAQEQLTSSTADDVLAEIMTPAKYKSWDPVSITERHRVEAGQIIDWIKSWENVHSMDDFRYKINLIVHTGFVSRKSAGYIAYVPIMWNKHNEQMVEIEERNSEYIGEIDERLTVDVTVLDKRVIQNFGRMFKSLIKFEDGDKNIIVWWCTSQDTYDRLSVDDMVSLAGTVSKHDEFRNEKNTTLKRCRIEKHLYKVLPFEWYQWARKETSHFPFDEIPII